MQNFCRSRPKSGAFNAQNVSNNSAVTPDGHEISRAQYFQAEMARVEPSYLFNSVLLKSQATILQSLQDD